MNEIGLPEATAQTNALDGFERMSDGIVGLTRSQSVEQELERDGIVSLKGERNDLLARSSVSPPVLRGWSITPLDDRILVEYASYKEGYACDLCKGKCHTGSLCQTCMGARFRIVDELDPCRVCNGTGKYLGLASSDEPCTRCGGEKGTARKMSIACQDCSVVGENGQNLSPTGFAKCVSCSGSGLAPGVMAIPDESKQDHSYGDILACGAQIFDLRPGDRVVFSKLSGIYIKGDRKRCCLLRRGEIMGFMVRK